MRRRHAVKSLPSDSSDDDDEPLSKLTEPKKPKPSNDDSSSESDIENYLQPADKLDLDSPFFNLQKDTPPPFEKIENNILGGVKNTLTDSESDNECFPTQPDAVQDIPSTSKLNFKQLHDYTKKLEEAKKHIEEYKARKQERDKELNIENLLAAGESKQFQLSDEKRAELEASLHSSDFESCSDSEKEGWEVVAEEQKEKNQVPKEGLQITVNMPNAVKKKKDVDLLAAVKRRINRVRKENQVLVHKVHLLCWIAHGNYVNSKINSENVLARALSLLPSQQCYPVDRTDLNYLTQILKWYGNTVVNVEKPLPDKLLEELLSEQVTKKEVYNKKMMVLIFVAILRSLGIQCRLILSFQVEPLRPPSSELHSLSTKTENKAADKTPKNTKGGKLQVDKQNSKRTSDTSMSKVKQVSKVQHTKSVEQKEVTKVNLDIRNSKTNTRSKSVSEASTSKTNKKASETKSKVSDAKSEHEDLKEKNPKSSSRFKSTSEASASKTNKKGSETKSKVSDAKSKQMDLQVKNTTSNTRSKNTSDARKTKEDDTKKDVKKSKKEYLKIKISKTNTRSKSTSDVIDSKSDENKKSVPKENLTVKNSKTNTRSKSTSEVSKLKSNKENKKETSKKATKTAKSEVNPENKRCTRSQTPKIPQVDGANDSDSSPKPNLKKLTQKPKKLTCPSKTHPLRAKKLVKYCDTDSEEDDFTSRSPFANKNKDSPQTNGANLKKLKNYVPKAADVRNDIVKLVKNSIREQKDITRSKTVRKRKSAPDSDDSDYIPEEIKKKRDSADDFAPKMKVKKRVQVKPDEDDPKVKKKQGLDVWCEVFMEVEEKWISVDVVKGQIHCVNELYTRASHPVSYVVAWNNDNSIKDVTRRYCTNFNTVTRKLRVDSKWWEATVKPFTGRQTVRDKEEDDELERQQLEKPLPTSIAEYKNHPLYVLKRHLLKFEALYPPDTPTLGFVRNEPVYSRQCVYTLHSRDIWLKHAKVVRPGEQPYKIVKARPRWDKLSNKIVTDQLLEIFGPWQVDDYDPPTAENGIVPRNAFGNVELFKPSMLPKKTVHLKLPGLNKVAKKLNIDCAPALVGFDFHGGWNHPTYDGYIVCEEFADTLVAAWEQEQEELERKEQEKIDKRVYGNWKRLIRGLLIRERLNAKYEFGGVSEKKNGKSLPKLKTKAKSAPKVVKKRKVESGSDSEG